MEAIEPIPDKTLTKEEYDAHVKEHGFGPFEGPNPGAKHRKDRNESHNGSHYTRGIG